MATFEFRLEALLAHRLQLEKDKQRKMAEVQQKIQAVVAQIQDAQARIAAENRTLGARELTGSLDMQYIGNERRFVGNLHFKIVMLIQKVAELEKDLAVARGELLEAARARKVIEKLRERQLARWRAGQDRKEAILMDEIATRIGNAPEAQWI